MSGNLIEFFKKMQEFFPSTKSEYTKNLKEYGEILETVIIEDIFMPEILMLLSENKEPLRMESIFIILKKLPMVMIYT